MTSCTLQECGLRCSKSPANLCSRWSLLLGWRSPVHTAMQGWSCRLVQTACQHLRQIQILKYSLLKNSATRQLHASIKTASTVTLNKTQASLLSAVTKHTSIRQAHSQLPSDTSRKDKFSFQLLTQLQASVNQLNRRYSTVPSAWQPQQTLQYRQCCRTSAFSTTQAPHAVLIQSKLKPQRFQRLPGRSAASLTVSPPRAGESKMCLSSKCSTSLLFLELLACC